MAYAADGTWVGSPGGFYIFAWSKSIVHPAQDILEM
jgi:hypothetical protein